MLELIGFLERLAPFSEPDLLVRDKLPLINVALKSFDRDGKPETDSDGDSENENENETELERRLKRYLQ